MLCFPFALVPFAGKRLLTLLAQFVAPALQHALGHPQIAGDLSHRLLAARAEAHRFPLEVAGVDALVWCLRLDVWLGHGSCPFRLRGVETLSLR
jgi:hypothetical protein